MYNRLLRLFLENKISVNGIQNAVEKGWLTQEEAARIINSGGMNNADN